MIILDPDRDGCVVWLINSPIIATRIKRDTALEICQSLISRLAVYKDVKNQYGNTIKKLFWADDVYLDVAAFGLTYKDIFNDYGLDVVDIRGRSANTIIPERIHVLKR